MRQTEKAYYVCDACGIRHEIDGENGMSSSVLNVQTDIHARNRSGSIIFQVEVCRYASLCLAKIGELLLSKIAAHARKKNAEDNERKAAEIFAIPVPAQTHRCQLHPNGGVMSCLDCYPSLSTVDPLSTVDRYSSDPSQRKPGHD